jgi:hypothetical protein
MAFVAEMNSPFTETDDGDVRVSLFTMLSWRKEGTSLPNALDLSTSYISSQIASAPEAYLEDLLVLAMQTRDIRGGKGERALFVAMMAALWERAPVAVAALIPLVPEYGCWRDMWELWEHVPGLRPTIYALVKSQWAQDCESAKPSLLAKWMPREGSKTWRGLANTLAQVLYPYIPHTSRLAHYRKAVSAVNRVLGTVEIKMCGNRWADLEPAHIPRRCFHIRKAALRNKMLLKRRGKYFAIDEERYATEDRRTCAQKVETCLKTVIRGKDIQMQELGLRATLDAPRYHSVRLAIQGLV